MVLAHELTRVHTSAILVLVHNEAVMLIEGYCRAHTCAHQGLQLVVLVLAGVVTL